MGPHHQNDHHHHHGTSTTTTSDPMNDYNDDKNKNNNITNNRHNHHAHTPAAAPAAHGAHHRRHHSHSHRSLLADVAMTAAADPNTIVKLDIDEHLQQLLSSSSRRLSSSSNNLLSSVASPTAPVSSRILYVEEMDDVAVATDHHQDYTHTDRNDPTENVRNDNTDHMDGNIETTIAFPPLTVDEPNETTVPTNTAKEEKASNHMSLCRRMMEYIKYIYSTLLLLFSIVVVMYAILTQQTVATSLNEYLAAVCFWICIVWLAIMEGTQGAVVGLQSVPSHSYQTSHPRTFQNTQLIYNNHHHHNSSNSNDGPNPPNNNSTDIEGNTGTPTTTKSSDDHNRLERFIIGRQFLVVLVVFLLNTLSTSIPGATLFVVRNDPEVDTSSSSSGATPFLNVITTIFLDNGVATILITIVIGQLIAQIVSSNCMLDFMNNYLVYGTEQISLWIESSGLLHSVYLFQLVMTTTTRRGGGSSSTKHVSRAEQEDRMATSQHAESIVSAASSSSTWSVYPSRSEMVVVVSKVFFWCRVLLSIAILIFSFAVTITALVQNQTKMWDGVPIPISILLFIVLMMIVGMLEGLQIALFAVIRRTDLETQYPMAYQNSQLILSKAQNLPAFLIGRQILVTGCTFIVARITAVDVDTATESNIFGVGDSLQSFFNTGLLGAIITTIMASLIWRIIAASYPVAFLSNPIVYILIRSCLYIETSGICSSAWILAYLHKKLMNYKNDEMYIGMNSTTTNDDDAASAEQHLNQNSDGKNCNHELDLEENAPTPIRR